MFRVTTFFQLTSTKSILQILPQFAHDFKDNLTTLYSKLVDDNNIDHKSYDVKQCVITYSVLLKLNMDELTDCKSKINQLINQFNCILTNLDQIEDTNPKRTKNGVIHSLLNLLFGDLNSLADIESIKNNMATLEENQDALSMHMQKTFNF